MTPSKEAHPPGAKNSSRLALLVGVGVVADRLFRDLIAHTRGRQLMSDAARADSPGRA